MSIFKKKNTFIASIFPKLLIAKNVVTWMPESCFRTPFRIQRLKGSQTLLKSARQRFYPNFPLISNKFSCLSYLLIGSEILEPFVNTLMADHMYSCHNWKKSLQQVQTQLSSKRKNIFWSFHCIFKIYIKFWAFFKKMTTFIPSIFPKFLITKDVVPWMPEKSCFRTPFGSQPFKRSKTRLKSARQHFYANFPLISNKLSYVSCHLVGSQILRPFFNTLTAYHMHSCRNWEKLPQQVQPQLSSKQKTFSARFIASLKFT